MKTIQKIIYVGFATAALASASLPAFAWTVWPDVDFEWYANAGKPVAPVAEVMPASRPGYTWAPAHWEWTGARQDYVAGRWIRDDYGEQVAFYSRDPAYASSERFVIRDRDGNVIPSNPEAYPIDSTRR